MNVRTVCEERLVGCKLRVPRLTVGRSLGNMFEEELSAMGLDANMAQGKHTLKVRVCTHLCSVSYQLKVIA